VYVLGQMVRAVKPGGEVLDLQVIRPDPVVEADGRVVCEIDGEPLFRTADAAAAAADALIRSGALVDEETDDHDVREHYDDGADLVAAHAAAAPARPAPHAPCADATVRCTRTLPRPSTSRPVTGARTGIDRGDCASVVTRVT
jgi:hypothetical protein